MKNIKKIIFLTLSMIIISGCGKNSSEKTIKNLTKKIEEAESYHLEGTLEIINNDDIQSIITTTDLKNINKKYLEDAFIYKVENGLVERK